MFATAPDLPAATNLYDHFYKKRTKTFKTSVYFIHDTDVLREHTVDKIREHQTKKHAKRKQTKMNKILEQVEEEEIQVQTSVLEKSVNLSGISGQLKPKRKRKRRRR